MTDKDDLSAVPVGGAGNHSYGKWFDHTDVNASLLGSLLSHMT